MHDLDPVFERFSRSEKIKDLATAIGLKNPLLLQSMYIFKQPNIGGEVTCHQDSTFLYTDPIDIVGLWFALEDATIENGCLWAIPGGHRSGLKSRWVRSPEGMKFEIFDAEPWPEDQLVPLEVSKGSLILLHGLLPHRSFENRSSRSRHAYTLHLISANANYPADNWLQRSAHDATKRLLTFCDFCAFLWLITGSEQPAEDALHAHLARRNSKRLEL